MTLAVARHLPFGRSQAGDRHLNFYDERDNLFADASGPTVNLYGAPNESEAGQILKNPTREGLLMVMLVQQRMGDGSRGASCHAAQGEHRLGHGHGGLPPGGALPHPRGHRGQASHHVPAGRGVLDVAVAIGAGSSPTPTGNYFIDGAVKVPYETALTGPIS